MSFPNTPSGAGGRLPGEGFVVGPDEGEPYWWLGSLTLNKVTGADSQGGIDVVDHRIPASYAPPRHVHHGQDEIFYILEGRFTVHCAERTWQAWPGCLVFLPRDVPHGFTLSDDGPGRTLLINSPAGFADVISELGVPATGLTLPGADVAEPSPEQIGAVSAAHGITPPDGSAAT